MAGGASGGFVMRAYESMLKECLPKKYPHLQKTMRKKSIRLNKPFHRLLRVRRLQLLLQMVYGSSVGTEGEAAKTGAEPGQSQTSANTAVEADSVAKPVSTSGMIRAHVLAILRSASSQVQAAIGSSGGSKASVSEGVEASVIYVRFKAAASELKPVLEEIESRASRKEYTQILAECHKLYCEQRLSLVRGIVHQTISEFAKKQALPSLTRSGCAYLIQVC